MARGAFFNRAGRRSGGDRPTEIVVPRLPSVRCACGTEGTFATLARDVVEGTHVRLCRSCGGVLFACVDGKWISATEMRGQKP